MSSNSAVGSLIGLAIGVLGVVVVAKIIDDALKEKKYVCPDCGHILRKNQKKCRNCGISIRWA